MRIMFVALAALFLSGQALAASPQDAKQYIQFLDEAIKAGHPALETGNPGLVAAHSRRMNALVKDGEKFGRMVFEQPYGYCFGAGTVAASWWQQTMEVARTGKEALPGSLASASQRYQEYRDACLEAADKEAKR